MKKNEKKNARFSRAGKKKRMDDSKYIVLDPRHQQRESVENAHDDDQEQDIINVILIPRLVWARGVFTETNGTSFARA